MSVSRIEESRLSVVLDVRQPQAYLALHPAAELAAACGVAANWLPVAVPPLKPPSRPAPDDDRGVRHRRYRAQAIAREIEAYAAVQGLVLREPYRDPDPAALHRAWLWVREHRPERLFEFLAEAFRAYWALELDVSSEPAVAALLERCGAGGAGFAAWCGGEGPARAAALAGELAEHGISRAPCFLVEGEVFVGRQHGPMIRWILAGRSGPVPI